VVGVELPSAGGTDMSVTYWIEPAPAHLPADKPLFVTLNPFRPPDPALVIGAKSASHPVFDAAAGLPNRCCGRYCRGRRRTWFCGAYFGAGFSRRPQAR
jgi:predicted NAD/FAD-binding protein